MTEREKVIGQLEADIKHADRIGALFVYIGRKQAKDVLDLLKERDKEIKNLRTWKAVERGEVIRTYEDRNEAKLE